MVTPESGIQIVDGIVKAPQTHFGLSTDKKPADPATV